VLLAWKWRRRQHLPDASDVRQVAAVLHTGAVMRTALRLVVGLPGLSANIRRDCKTVGAMMETYCRQTHGRPRGTLCQDCAALEAYAITRLAKCPFGPRKTTCRTCPIHCYRPDERAAIKVVMREAGPKMLLRHPWLALRHLWVERQGPPPWPLRTAQSGH